MADQDNSVYDLTSPVVSGHPHLDEAKPFIDKRSGKPTGEPKYSINLYFDPTHPDWPGLKTAAVAVAKAGAPAGTGLKDLVFPFADGNKLADAYVAQGKNEAEKATRAERSEFMRGKGVLSCRSKFPPNLAAIINGKAVDLASDDKVGINKAFYFGVEVLAQVKFNYYAVGNNKPGVNAYLQQALSTGKGKRLTAQRSAASTFSGYVGKPSQEDVLGPDLDDEIPF